MVPCTCSFANLRLSSASRCSSGRSAPRSSRSSSPALHAAAAASASPDLSLHRIVTPFEVLRLDAAQHPRGRLVGEPRVLRQGPRPVPGEERGEAAVQLLGLLALEVEVVVRLPAQVHVRVVVGDARDAAALQQRQRRART